MINAIHITQLDLKAHVAFVLIPPSSGAAKWQTGCSRRCYLMCTIMCQIIILVR